MDAYERLTEVGRTALGVAAARAGERRRADRLFDDPLAAAFVRAAGGGESLRSRWLHAQRSVRVWRALGDYLAIRTRFFDDYLMRACAGGCRQVVLLAAGLDTRAFRLAWPAGVRLIELDRPDVLDFKEAVLAAEAAAPACERVVVPADLSEDWPAAVARAGFRVGEPTAWLAEGLLIYLPEEVGDCMLARLSELSAPGSRLGIECTGRAMLSSPDVTTALQGPDQDPVRTLSTLWRGGPDAPRGPDAPGPVTPHAPTGPLTPATPAGRRDGPRRDPVGWLAQFGWVGRDHEIAELAAVYGRPVPPAFDPDRPGSAHGGLVLAERVDG